MSVHIINARHRAQNMQRESDDCTRSLSATECSTETRKAAAAVAAAVARLCKRLEAEKPK